jgi:hypothetical protein
VIAKVYRTLRGFPKYVRLFAFFINKGRKKRVDLLFFAPDAALAKNL